LGVSVNPVPKASFTAVQSAGGVKLTPDEANVSCKWYFGDGDSSFLYSPYHAYVNNGIYTVSLYTRSIYGCLNQSTMDVNISTVGLDGDMFSRNFKFNAQPNPFTEQTNLSLTLQESADISMDVYDMSGRLVHSLAKEQNFKAGTYSFLFQAANYQTAGGVYLVRLKVGEEIRNLRIVEIGR
jgi:PKD repeat protein